MKSRALRHAAGRGLSAVPRGRVLRVLALGLAIALTGCENLRGWSYRPEPATGARPIVDGTVAVLPFEDRRPNENVDKLYMQYVPLLPYGWADYGTPEAMAWHVSSGRGLWTFRPVDDLTRAVASELDSSGIFRDAFVGERASDGDFILRGEILSTGYTGKIYSYGLSAWGPLLWFLGLPSGQASNTLEIRLTLSPPGSTTPVWSHTLLEKYAKRGTVYRVDPDFRYDELLKAGMKKALPDLRSTLSRARAGSLTPAPVKERLP